MSASVMRREVPSNSHGRGPSLNRIIEDRAGRRRALGIMPYIMKDASYRVDSAFSMVFLAVAEDVILKIIIVKARLVLPESPVYRSKL